MTTRRARMMSGLAGAAAALGATATAGAGGLIVPGYGSQGQPRAGAFVAKADDPSALYYNPAGFARQRGTSVQISFNLLDFDQRYQRAGVHEPREDGVEDPWLGEPYDPSVEAGEPALGLGGFQAVPSILVTTDLGGKTPLVFGAGIIAEHAYPGRSYGDYTFEDPAGPAPAQRYDVVEQEATIAFPSIAAAYGKGDLAVGVRLSWGFAAIKSRTMVWAVRNLENDIHKDADFAAETSDAFVPVAQIGMHYKLGRSIELGAQYTSPRTVESKGDATAPLGARAELGGVHDFIEPIVGPGAQCADGGTVTTLKTCLDLALPQTATLGGRYLLRDAAGRERGDVELDVQWEDWSNASDVEVLVDGKSSLTGLVLQPQKVRHGFRDTFSFRLGGGYDVPVGDNVLTARAGIAYDTAAAPVGWTRADMDGIERITLGLGVGYAFGDVRVDLGGGYVHEPRRTVADDCQPTPTMGGCDGSGEQTPVADRERPDPIQPLSGDLNQTQGPYNEGTYEQHYLLLSLGVTYAF